MSRIFIISTVYLTGGSSRCAYGVLLLLLIEAVAFCHTSILCCFLRVTYFCDDKYMEVEEEFISIISRNETLILPAGVRLHRPVVLSTALGSTSRSVLARQCPRKRYITSTCTPADNFGVSLLVRQPGVHFAWWWARPRQLGHHRGQLWGAVFWGSAIFPIQARSKRSAFITLFQADTKSCKNLF